MAGIKNEEKSTCQKWNISAYFAEAWDALTTLPIIIPCETRRASQSRHAVVTKRFRKGSGLENNEIFAPISFLPALRFLSV